MPIYEYRCLSCGHQFELLRSFTNKDDVACLRCGKSAQRLLSAGTGVIIKSEGSSRETPRRRTGSGCDRVSPCCGAESPCDKPPCES